MERAFLFALTGSLVSCEQFVCLRMRICKALYSSFVFYASTQHGFCSLDIHRYTDVVQLVSLTRKVREQRDDDHELCHTPCKSGQTHFSNYNPAVCDISAMSPQIHRVLSHSMKQTVLSLPLYTVIVGRSRISRTHYHLP